MFGQLLPLFESMANALDLFPWCFDHHRTGMGRAAGILGLIGTSAEFPVVFDVTLPGFTGGCFYDKHIDEVRISSYFIVVQGVEYI